MPGVRQKEHRFVTDTGMRNAIFIIRMIPDERRIQMEKYVHLYFIGYAKYFDKVEQKSLFELLGKPDIYEGCYPKFILKAKRLHTDRKLIKYAKYENVSSNQSYSTHRARLS